MLDGHDRRDQPRQHDDREQNLQDEGEGQAKVPWSGVAMLAAPGSASDGLTGIMGGRRTLLIPMVSTLPDRVKFLRRDDLRRNGEAHFAATTRATRAGP